MLKTKNKLKKIELLSPAKDLLSGIAAINHGADAVYIGADRFGARKAAGNSLEDISKLIKYAHGYYAKVYVAVNTILFDNELEDARLLIYDLYNLGSDAIIFQDFALLEMDLPPVPLFASTQTHNYTLQKVKFLEEIGVKRVILARELSLERIKEISSSSQIELEVFISGALCVSLSGQCYMSYATTGRSANRGECSQSCRMLYSLIDKKGNVLIKDKYLLSLKDLNLSNRLSELIAVGVSSFKIEGRLKDINYVKNTTAFFRREIDKFLEGKTGYKKSSSGKVFHSFEPEIAKTFNRGFTEYFVDGKVDKIAKTDTPKAVGEFLGEISVIGNNYFTIKTDDIILPGDGLCYLTKDGVLQGMNVNRSSGSTVFTNKISDFFKGQKIYRNNNIAFERELARDKTIRRIDASIEVQIDGDVLLLIGTDEDGIVATEHLHIYDDEIKELSEVQIIKQFSKSGETLFNVTGVIVRSSAKIGLSLSKLNELRRTLLTNLMKERLLSYTPQRFEIIRNNYPYPEKVLDYRGNVVNKLAAQFFSRHNVQAITGGMEQTMDVRNKTLMVTKYCIKNEFTMCPFDEKHNQSKLPEPLYLVDRKNKYKLEFHCAECEMHIINT